MNAIELRNKSVPELQSELEGLLREGFNLRMQHGTGQMAQGHRLRQNRRAIARVKTILGEKAGN